jgi:hypothetical protein
MNTKTGASECVGIWRLRRPHGRSRYRVGAIRVMYGNYRGIIVQTGLLLAARLILHVYAAQGEPYVVRSRADSGIVALCRHIITYTPALLSALVRQRACAEIHS